jgi:hypothetical protein
MKVMLDAIIVAARVQRLRMESSSVLGIITHSVLDVCKIPNGLEAGRFCV